MKKFLSVLASLLLVCGPAAAETAWVMCDGYVNIRDMPGKKSQAVGFLDPGDSFETDGIIKNGFVQAQIGEGGENWIFAGYVTNEKPERVDERYVCTAKRRVACRRWIDGPQIRGKVGWLYNGTNVRVYWRTGEWSVTSRGYVRSEWLEADPE
mgnify:CR=1 FL=1